MRKHSNQVELDQFLKTINENNDNSQHITKSAFIQARKQLSHTAFTELNRQLNGSIYINPQLYKTWKGFRLCAIDGTSIRLPDETEITEHFGVQKGRLGKADCTIAMASTFYDVLNHIVIDSSINHKGTSEKHCAAEHLKYARYNDLVIYDRGYCAFWFYAHHIKHNQSFCMRAKANQSLAIKAFVESDKKEALVTFEPNKPLAGTALNACSWMVG